MRPLRLALGLGLALSLAASASALTLVKSDPPQGAEDGIVCPGDHLLYQVCITNSGGSNASGLIFTDSLYSECFSDVHWVDRPSGPGISDCTSGQPWGIQLCLQGFSVGPFSTLCMTYDATVAAGVSNGQPCTNQASVNQGIGAWESNLVVTTIDCPTAGPDLRLIETFNPTSPTEGTNMDVLLDVRNAGLSADSNVVVQLDIPDGSPTGLQLGFVSATSTDPAMTYTYQPPPAGANSAGLVQTRHPTLGAGVQYRDTVRLSVGVTCGSGSWGFCNQSTVSSTTFPAPSGIVSDNDDNDLSFPESTCSGRINSTGRSNVTGLTKSVTDLNGGNVEPGDRLHFRLAINNAGACSELSGTVQDDLPAGLDLDLASVTVPTGATNSSSGPPAGANGSGLVNVSNITAVSGDTLVEFDAVVRAGLGCVTACNTGRYRFPSMSTFRNSNQVCVQVVPPGGGGTVTVTKAVQDLNGGTTVPGDRLRYTVTFTNPTTCSLSPGTFTDNLPAGVLLDPASVTLPAGAVNASTGPPTGTNAAGLVAASSLNATPGTTTIVFDAVVQSSAACADACNTGSYQFPTTGGPVATNSACVTVVDPSASLSPTATKSVVDLNGGNVVPGDRLRYTITFNWAGLCPRTGGTISDDLPAGVFLDLATVSLPPGATNASVGSPAGANGAGTVIASGVTAGVGTTTVTFEAVVGATALCQTACNTASFQWAPAAAATSNAACVDVVDATASQSPTGTKSVADLNGGLVLPGDRLRYTLSFDWPGACPRTGGTITDDLPAGVFLDTASIVLPGGATNTSAASPAGTNGAGVLRASGVTASPGTTTITFDAVVQASAVCQTPCNTATYQWPSAASATTAAACVSVANPGGGSPPTATKSARDVNGAPLQVGDTIAYTITVDVPFGCAPLTGATFSDVLEAGLDLDPTSVAITLAGPTNTSQGPPADVVSFTGIDAPVSSSFDITFNATVTASATGQVCNQGTLVAGGSSIPTNQVCLPLPATCSPLPGVVPLLKAAKSAPNDIRWTWNAEPVGTAATYRVYETLNGDGALAATANAVTAAANPGIVVMACESAVGGLSCLDVGGLVTPPRLVFYQVVGACDTGAEGPN